MKLKALLSLFALTAMLFVACSGGDHASATEGENGSHCAKDSSHCEGKDRKKCCKGDSTKCSSDKKCEKDCAKACCSKDEKKACEPGCEKSCCKKKEVADSSAAEEAEHHEMHEEMEMEDGD